VPEPVLRILARPRAVLCRVPLPAARGVARELALVASPAPPFLRRLIVYRRSGAPVPSDTPRAA
jgi:hypothetical protein